MQLLSPTFTADNSSCFSKISMYSCILIAISHSKYGPFDAKTLQRKVLIKCATNLSKFYFSKSIINSFIKMLPN